MSSFEELKEKAAGDLIYAQDWVDLIANIQQMDTDLRSLISSTADELRTLISTTTDELRTELQAEIATERGRIDTLDERMGAAEGRLETAQGDIVDLRSDLEPLLQAYRRVTLETSKSRSSIGELVELTARVTTLDGEPVRITTADDRPWIDFLVSWGQLKPMPGFESRGDPGDRSIAVRVDGDGIARIRVKAEHTDDSSEEEEDEVAATLTTRLADHDGALSDLLLQAATPMEAKNIGAFQILNQEYDRRDSRGMRRYVDRYYVRNVGRISGRLRPNFRHRWRDYHSTVIAFLKDDNRPTTADAGRATSSIQVSFRDWIAPWIQLGYLDRDQLRPRIDGLRDRLQPRIGSRYDDTLTRFRGEIDEVLREQGVLGRYRDLGALSTAIDEIQPAQQPDFYHGFVGAMQDGLKVQRALLVSESMGEEDESEVLLRAFTQTAAKSDTNSEQVRDRLLGELETKAGEVEQRLRQETKQEQQQFQDQLLAEDGRVRQVERFVDTVSGQIDSLQRLNVNDVQTGLSEIVGLKQRLMAVEGRA